MKKLILLQATSDGSCRTIRSTYGKLGGVMRSQMTAEPLRLYCKYIMKKLTLLQATSNGVSRTIRANYYKQGGQMLSATMV